MSTDLQSLISRLESWSVESSSFHLNRQLSDEILIADGWNCEPDPTFEGGFRWWFGTNPEYSTGDNRPHVLNDLNAAIGVVPFEATFTLVGNYKSSHFTASVHNPKDSYLSNVSLSKSSRLTVAILIAALKHKQHEQATAGVS